MYIRVAITVLHTGLETTVVGVGTLGVSCRQGRAWSRDVMCERERERERKILSVSLTAREGGHPSKGGDACGGRRYLKL